MSQTLNARVVLLGTLFGASLFVCGHTAHAALLYLDPQEATINRGDTETIAVRLDTDEGECINTVDAVVEYGAALVAADVSRGDSILSVWLEEPTIDPETRTVRFAGGIPGGYCGRIAGDPRLTNVVAEIVFRAPGLSIGGERKPIAAVALSDASRVLLHDGLGTEASLRLSDALVTVLDKPGGSIDDTWSDRVAGDTLPPADFSITLTSDTNAFSGKYFIVFNTLDKQSGIDHYDVMEEPFEEFSLFKWGAATAPWKRVQSPYVLKDQTLNSTIRVRAVDKAGNETISVLVPEEALRSYSMQRLINTIALGVAIVLIVGLIGYALWRRRAQFQEQTLTENEDEQDI